jgi:hypothetical protein
MSFAAYVKYIAATLDPATAHHATGLFLFVWLVFSVKNLVIQRYN